MSYSLNYEIPAYVICKSHSLPAWQDPGWEDWSTLSRDLSVMPTDIVKAAGRTWGNPTYYLADQPGFLLLWPTDHRYNKVFVIPMRHDFGLASIGAAVSMVIVSGWPVPSILESAYYQSADFRSNLPTLPLSFPPTWEQQITMSIVAAVDFQVQDSEVSYIFNGAYGTAYSYFDAFLAITLFELVKNQPATKATITYNYDTELKRLSTGDWFRWPKLLRPVRSISLKVADCSEERFKAYDDAIKMCKQAALIPIWPWMSDLMTSVTSADSAVTVADASEFEVGASCFLKQFDNGPWESVTIESIVGNVITFPATLQNSYKAHLTKVVPCLTGFAKIKKLLTESRFGAVSVELEMVEQIPITGAPSTGAVTLMLRPDEVAISAGLDSDRQIIGKDTGVQEVVDYSTNRVPMIHSFTYLLKQLEWKTLRDAFFRCRGRHLSLSVPTWRSELRVVAYSPAGGNTINVWPPEYIDLWVRYPNLLIDWGVATQQVTVSGATAHPTYVTLVISPVLARPVFDGIYASQVVEAFFLEDQLDLEFGCQDLVKVDVGFLEKPTSG